MSYYSVLMYRSEIDLETYKEIYSFVDKGIKVFLIVPLEEDELKKIEVNIDSKMLKKISDSNLINIISNFEVSMKFGDRFNIYDGDMSEDLKDELRYNEDFVRGIDYDIPLNLEQYEIEHENPNKHLIVEAGAGSGKTKTMLDRCMYLREKQSISFREIIMITFTNKAANEMKEKLSKRVENYYKATKDVKYLQWIDEITEMKIGTIHSFAKWFIDEYGYKVNLNGNKKIASLKHIKYGLLEEIIDKYNKKYPEKFHEFKYIPQYQIIKGVMAIENHIVSKGLDIKKYKDLISWGEDSYGFNHLLEYMLTELVSELEEYKRINDVMEISDLIIKLQEFSKSNITESFGDFKYVMVDEFQDTDIAQINFLTWMIENCGCRTFVVGDKKQSIYRFRGAESTAFEEFKNRLCEIGQDNEYVQKSMRINYRSTENVLTSINGFFENLNKLKDTQKEIKKFNFEDEDKLICGNKNIGNDNLKSVRFFEKNDGTLKMDDERVDYIADIVKWNNSENKEQIGVLFRTNGDLEEFVEKFEDIGITCLNETKGNFYRNIAVREFYILLKAILYPKVDTYQYAFANSSYGRGIATSEIFDKFDISTKTPYLKKVIEECCDTSKLRELWSGIRNEFVFKSLNGIIENFEPHLNFGAKLYRERNNNGRLNMDAIETEVMNYKMNLDHLLSILEKEFGNGNVGLNVIEEYLRIKISTDNEENEKKLSVEDGTYDIRCMTVHKSKGLEFDHVIMPKTSNVFLRNGSKVNVFITEGIDDFGLDIFKIAYEITLSSGSIAQNDNHKLLLEEERSETISEELRLLYVALTRCRKTMHLEKKNIMPNSGKLTSWMKAFEMGGMEGERV